ncbi:hypothetical protein BKA70DRAFT_1232747 [Coprinopsis sp. MPI-PUGE-AT-0042]|nr:hypothetical protein BKA70DRAFT_1232747 [Coprinopsis sp. MPI-PUGE-AT-0042]
MSLPRALLVTIQAIAHKYAFTPPNPTKPKERYHTQEMWILQCAPAVFWAHDLLCTICAIFEVIHYLSSLMPTSSSSPSSLLSPLGGGTAPPYWLVCGKSSAGDVRLTPLFVLGSILLLLGAHIRLACFKTLGPMFTFDLTVHPEHRLVTSGFYGYVRHPAYTGSMMLVAGLAFSHLTRGSWLTECAPSFISTILLSPSSPIAWILPSWVHPSMTGTEEGLWAGTGRMVVWALWWFWTYCVGMSRADAEDKQMHALFKTEWEVWAREVPWWFFPGLV